MVSAAAGTASTDANESVQTVNDACGNYNNNADDDDDDTGSAAAATLS